MHENYEFFQGNLDSSNNFTLYVTYRCNWFCDYCSEDTHNRGIVNFEDIKAKVELIPNNTNVAVTGGEPGILKKEQMSWILNTLKEKNCAINMNTNGTFFKRHRELCDIPDSFLYHCSEHLEDEEIYIPDFVDFEKILFQLVVTDDTVHRLEYYINKYPDIKFLIYGADQIEYEKGRIGTGLSRANGFAIYRKYKDVIHPESYLRLIASCREINDIEKLKALR